MALDITGMSNSMKRHYGPAIVAAIQQADAFTPGVLQGMHQVDEFRLDTTNIFGKQVGG